MVVVVIVCVCSHTCMHTICRRVPLTAYTCGGQRLTSLWASVEAGFLVSATLRTPGQLAHDLLDGSPVSASHRSDVSSGDQTQAITLGQESLAHIGPSCQPRFWNFPHVCHSLPLHEVIINNLIHILGRKGYRLREEVTVWLNHCAYLPRK